MNKILVATFLILKVPIAKLLVNELSILSLRLCLDLKRLTNALVAVLKLLFKGTFIYFHNLATIIQFLCAYVGLTGML